MAVASVAASEVASVSKPTKAQVAIATLNQTVGDWRGNRKRILDAAQEAEQRGAKLLLCPELCISGYSLLDRVYRASTLTYSFDSLVQIAEASKDLDLILCVGLPICLRTVLYNAVAVVAQGQIWGFSCKSHLAHGDCEYEERYYAAWPQGHVEDWEAPDGKTYPVGALLFNDERVGCFAFEICEDAFRSEHPSGKSTLAGAELILNPSASWFSMGKHTWRRDLIKQRSREGLCAYLYASLLGTDNTRLIFDGAGLICAEGELLAEADRLRIDREINVADAWIDLGSLRRSRRETGSWRRQASQVSQVNQVSQVSQVNQVRLGAWASADVHLVSEANQVNQVTIAISPDYLPKTATSTEPSLDWWVSEKYLGNNQEIKPNELALLELELVLCLGLHDYLRKAHINAVALALSGGRDSAMVALLVYRVWRYRYPHLSHEELQAKLNQHFHCAYLATDNSGLATQTAAQALAKELGARFYDLNIQEALQAHHSLISTALGRPLSWDNPVDDITLQNVQARLRGSAIWMLANNHKALLLATSNKSECAVGYTTMDGDTSGGLSPIADVPKSLISLWLNWARQRYQLESLDLINGLEPSAELRPQTEGEAQTDEADLMPFEILDQLMYGFIELALSPLELFQRYWPIWQDRYQNPEELQAHIVKFVRLFCFSQWKRERFAVSFRIMNYDLDPKGGGRYPVIQAPFTEELEALDHYIKKMKSQR